MANEGRSDLYYPFSMEAGYLTPLYRFRFRIPHTSSRPHLEAKHLPPPLPHPYPLLQHRTQRFHLNAVS